MPAHACTCLQVEIDLRAGERLFCSEQEAAAAGWSRWAPASGK